MLVIEKCGVDVFARAERDERNADDRLLLRFAKG